MEGGIFLTAKDLMKLNGSTNYNSCANLHRAIRDAIEKGKRKLQEQCPLMFPEYCPPCRRGHSSHANFARKYLIWNQQSHGYPRCGL